MVRKKARKFFSNKKTGQSDFKHAESYTSLLLGGLVVIISTIIFISFLKNNAFFQKKQNQHEATSSLKTGPNLNDNQSVEYQVKENDTLWVIAEKNYKNGYKWVELARENNLKNPDNIIVGMKLQIPALTVKKTIGNTQTIQPNSQNVISASSYTVVKGDNLWDISVRAYNDGYKWIELAKINNLANPDLIHPGNILKIPR